ncbi:MAG: HAD family hydrolase [Ignavibacteria bacterium]
MKSDPLPSWNDTKPKKNIFDYVNLVIDKTSPDFIKPSERIVTIDNDGTLWSEKPFYFQFQFAMDRIKAIAPDHPEWKDDPLFNAAIENDINKIAGSGKEGLIKLLLASHSGMTTVEFENSVTEWINTAKHPKTNKLYKEMVFLPMLELLEYLKENDFIIYIVSGGGIEFMRAWVEEVYSIPPERVMGSSIKVKFEMRDEGPVLLRLPEINFVDDNEGKPVGIHQFIGNIPAVSVGNSDGDLEMMQWTASGKGKKFMLYIHHTDDVREWAYDKDSYVGRFDKGLVEAAKNGWTVVDMKNDWKVIFPFDK